MEVKRKYRSVAVRYDHDIMSSLDRLAEKVRDIFAIMAGNGFLDYEIIPFGDSTVLLFWKDL